MGHSGLSDQGARRRKGRHSASTAAADLRRETDVRARPSPLSDTAQSLNMFARNHGEMEESGGAQWDHTASTDAAIEQGR